MDIENKIHESICSNNLCQSIECVELGDDTITFQYFSDVHTEMYKSNPLKIKKFEITPIAPYLILAGDIGHPFSQIYHDFLAMLSPLFKHIFIVSGNHEYYQTPSAKKMHIPDEFWMDVVDMKIQEICESFDNITYLNNSIYDIPDTNITIFGGTFWTNVKDEEKYYVRQYLVDYREIPNFNLDTGIQKHITSCNVLEQYINSKSNANFIVVSHHLPSYSLINEKYLNIKPPLNSAYATDIPIANHPRIKAWVAGHTHIPIQKGKFYVNPIGYPGEQKQKPCFNRLFKI